MRFPVGPADLVLDQLVDGFRVRDAQQRLGQTHEHHTFGTGQLVFLHEGIDAAAFGGFGADHLDQPGRVSFDRACRVLIEGGDIQQAIDLLGLIHAISGEHILIARIVEDSGC